MVQGVDARCGGFLVPENRATPNGRTIGLYVVVLPAHSKPVRKDAVTYLAGGPGSAATDQAAYLSQQLTMLNMNRDILLVDMAMDDLDAVRAALGYRKLDVIGSSYGATAAQVYAKLHPSSSCRPSGAPAATCRPRAPAHHGRPGSG